MSPKQDFTDVLNVDTPGENTISKIKKFFRFIFFGKGWKSDLAFLIFIIILYKFVAEPLLGFILNTRYPIVIIVSNSMEHQNFDISWYLDHNFTIDEIEKFPFKNGINIGDAVIVKGVKCSELRKGDVAAYITKYYKYPIVHRIVNIVRKNNTCYLTFKGDNNPDSLFFERNVSIKNVVGKVIFRIPYIGLPKVYLLKALGLL